MRATRFLGPILLLGLALPACAGPDDVDDVEVGKQSTELRVVLSLDRAAYGAQDQVVASVSITNVGRSTAKLLSWALPQADLEEPVFRLTVDGHSVPYVGAHYKRPRAEESDFVQLKAGETLSRSVDLGLFYDLSQSGAYSFRVDVESASSNTVSASVEGRAAKPSPPPPEPTDGPLTFSNCTLDQQQQAAEAAGVAGDMSDNALAYLTGTAPGPTQRYTTWFGGFSSAGWDTATDHYGAISDAFATQHVNIDCKCKKKYYAYVYPNRPYEIFVCKVFWTAPMSGTDSKGGTLVHEMSHFDVTAGTDDWAYGQSACKSLALSDPERALDNADSHEYFAENTPALP